MGRQYYCNVCEADTKGRRLVHLWLTPNIPSLKGAARSLVIPYARM